jgi:hypothetical protein
LAFSFSIKQSLHDQVYVEKLGFPFRQTSTQEDGW